MSDTTFGYEDYLSVNTWRYGSAAMRRVWSEATRRRLMRRVWLALATAQHEAGLVGAEQVADLAAHVDSIDIARAHAIEQETRHDVMAEIRAYAEQCPLGGGIIHLGATSADIIDNVDVLRLREALRLLEGRLRDLLSALAEQIRATADEPVIAYTHIQPAEPTTLGYRLAVYAQDLYEDWRALRDLIVGLRGKGFKGAVGTQASFAELLHGRDQTPQQLEARGMALLDLPYYPIATQTYTRQQDWRAVNVLAGIAGSLHKFALDFRVLQSPPFGEWAEPFGAQQVGSSAMPFKRNPINMENICSLARYVAALPAVLWDNHSQAILERSLDDSANRRLVLPEACLATDEMLRRSVRTVRAMRFDHAAMARNLAIYGPFAATERVLMALVARGADRQQAHDWIRAASLEAWAALQDEPGDNPLTERLAARPEISALLDAPALAALMAAEAHVGSAPQRAYEFAEMLMRVLPAAA